MMAGPDVEHLASENARLENPALLCSVTSIKNAQYSLVMMAGPDVASSVRKRSIRIMFYSSVTLNSVLRHIINQPSFKHRF